jgi:hypothetical protein
MATKVGSPENQVASGLAPRTALGAHDANVAAPVALAPLSIKKARRCAPTRRRSLARQPRSSVFRRVLTSPPPLRYPGRARSFSSPTDSVMSPASKFVSQKQKKGQKIRAGCEQSNRDSTAV